TCAGMRPRTPESELPNIRLLQTVTRRRLRLGCVPAAEPGTVRRTAGDVECRFLVPASLGKEPRARGVGAQGRAILLACGTSSPRSSSATAGGTQRTGRKYRAPTAKAKRST